MLNSFLVRPTLDPLAREQITEIKNKKVCNVGEKQESRKLSDDEELGDEKTLEDNSPVDEESSLVGITKEDTCDTASDQGDQGDQDLSSNNSEDSRAHFLPPPTQTRFVGKLQQMRGTKVAEPTLILNNHLNLIYLI